MLWFRKKFAQLFWYRVATCNQSPAKQYPRRFWKNIENVKLACSLPFSNYLHFVDYHSTIENTMKNSTVCKRIYLLAQTENTATQPSWIKPPKLLSPVYYLFKCVVFLLCKYEKYSQTFYLKCVLNLVGSFEDLLAQKGSHISLPSWIKTRNCSPLFIYLFRCVVFLLCKKIFHSKRHALRMQRCIQNHFCCFSTKISSSK